MAAPNDMPKNPFDAFCEAFGEADTVRNEIYEFWQEHSEFSPLAIYKHLLSKRVKAGTISAERAHYLNRYFAESFIPEHTTGYIEKHREPLITAFAAAYSEQHPSHPILRVEADIMNLGGLNNALEAVMGKGHEREARTLADQVILVMTTILNARLAECGEVVPIRRGGDELTLYVKPKAGISIDQVQNAISEAEKEIARFITMAGLRNIAHTKEGKEPGVGIGCALSNLTDGNGALLSEVALVNALDEGIKEAKRNFQEYSGEKDAEASSVTSERINKVIGLAYSATLPHETKQHRLTDELPLIGKTPEGTRLKNMMHRLLMLQKSMNNATEKLLKSTVALTARNDFVTGLPLFANFEPLIAGTFKQHHGNIAQVLHLDFNNLSGGNNLGPWIGDIQAREFSRAIVDGMEACDYLAYKPYLMAQGGGKFTVLLPADKVDKKAVEKLTTEIEKAWQTRSKKPLRELGLTTEQADASSARLREALPLELSKRQQDWQEGQPMRSIAVNAMEMTLGQISHSKSRKQGSHIVTLAPEIDLSKVSVKAEVATLERMTRRGQEAIEPLERRRAAIKKELENEGRYVRNSEVKKEKPKPSFAASIGKKVIASNRYDTMRLEPKDESTPTR